MGKVDVHIPAKYRVIFYWVTIVVTAASAIVVGVGAALGIIDSEAVERGVMVSALVMGTLSPILALFNIKSD